jgi:hypothetical protein
VGNDLWRQWLRPKKVITKRTPGVPIVTFLTGGFMATHSLKSLEAALAHVQQDRRGFLKTLIVGSAVAAIPVMTSQAMAAEGDEGDEGKKKKKKKKEGDE